MASNQAALPAGQRKERQAAVPAIAVGPEAIAEALGITRSAVYWLINQNYLPSFKIGKRRLARVEAVEDLARQLEAGEIKVDLTQERR